MSIHMTTPFTIEPAANLLKAFARRPGRTLVASLLAISGFFLLFPGLDLVVSGEFVTRGTGFALTDDATLRTVRDIGTWITVAILAGSLAALTVPLIARRLPAFLKPHQALFLISVYLLGPGLVVNGIFKNVFGRARPRDIFAFGGNEIFTPVWTVHGGCSGNCSFVSGEGAAAAAMLALIFVIPRRDRLAVGLGLTAVAAMVSLNRIAFGGHFLSDVLLAWVITLGVMVALRPVFFGAWASRIDGAFLTAGDRIWRRSETAEEGAGAAGTKTAKAAPLQRARTMPGAGKDWMMDAHAGDVAQSAAADVAAPGTGTGEDAGRRFKRLSVVVPARNEAENLRILVREIGEALAHRTFEVVVVDDGSTDDTEAALAALKADGLPIRHVRHERSAGQSRAVRTGLFAAAGDVVITIDGDGQNDPAFIPQLVEALEKAGPAAGLVAGQRVGRTDTRLKRASSRFANNLRTAILNDATRDTGCGLKAMPTALFRQLPYFDGWHRYLPALVLREGYDVLHLDVKDRERRFGRSNYGILDRGLRGVLDLFGVWWLMRRGRRSPGRVEERRLETRP